jgi:sterol desaturase/sphingolipid hydroxylase (fatty acid hydroxylase superfamily)
MEPTILTLPRPTEFAVPLFIGLIILELIYSYKTGRTKYEAKDTFTSVFMGLGSTISGAFFATFLINLSYWVWSNFGLFDFGAALWVFALAFVLDDLAYYWLHRMGHRMRWMWAAHVIHHSSQHYNLSTALRQTWTGRLTPGILFRMPLFMLGIEPIIVFFAAGINLVYQFWIHTEAIEKMPRWFEYIFNTPSHHRVHHANNPQYLDANYAGVFMIWDRIFGTYIPEEKTTPCRYGLVTDLATFNPLRIAFHEWVGIFKDVWSAKSWKDRLLFVIAPPGWTPDGSRMTSDMIRAAWLERQAKIKQPKSSALPKENVAAE